MEEWTTKAKGLYVEKSGDLWRSRGGGDGADGGVDVSLARGFE
jgi:hypothetical protein